MHGQHVDVVVSTKILAVFEKSSIQVSRQAAALLRMAIRAQIEEGILPTEEAMMDAIEKLPIEDLPIFYRVKYGDRPITFNRMLRLISDLHDIWVTVRHA